MHKALALLLIVSGDAVAHPGHGLPGWIHPHAADYALAGLALFFIVSLVLALKK